MNPDISLLQPYPFERLAALKNGVTAPPHLTPIALSIGEPKHEPPAFVVAKLIASLSGLSNYPATKGLLELREAIASWASQRFHLAPGSLSAERNILPVAGTREALFAFAQAVIDRRRPNPTVLMPNPFYQIYEGAAILAGAEPYFLNCTLANNWEPDFDAVPTAVWRATQLLYICSPGNPSGAILSIETLEKLIRLADEFDFIIASDECYAELYFDEANPPAGLLQVCAHMGRHDFARCVVFHSLSKRSNLPGLRSGFVAGDAQVLAQFLQYRTYHGCALPVPTQLASAAAWADEEHVIKNRQLYRQKFQQALAILGPVTDVQQPPGGFYLWLKTPYKATEFARDLFAQQNVTVLPGEYLARATTEGNPAEYYVRLALVAEVAECAEACERIRDFLLQHLQQ